MIKKIPTTVLFVLVSVFACLICYAQDTTQPQLFFVEDVTLKPSERADFLEVIKEFLNYFEGEDFPYELNSYMTSDYHVYFTYPLNSIGEVEDLYTEFNKLGNKVDPAKWSALLDNQFRCIEKYVTGIYYMRPDLSYFPENPRITPEETNYLEWSFAYVEPGKEKEIETLWREWIELYREKAVENPYYAWVGFIGPELPQYIFIFPGKNALDFHQASADTMEKLGEDVNPLYEKTFRLVKKVERKTGWVLKDLTYVPESE